MIRAYVPTSIKYTKDDGEVSTRTIIPTINVPQNIRAVDISKLNEQDQIRLIGLFAEYEKYVENHFSKLFNFNDWVEHTTGIPTEDLPWRTFKYKNIDILD